MSKAEDIEIGAESDDDFHEAVPGQFKVVLDENEVHLYDDCIEKIKLITEDPDLSGEEKASELKKALMNYFEDSDEYSDAFGGFLKLLSCYKNHTNTYLGKDEFSLVHQIFNVFCDFLHEAGSMVSDSVLAQTVQFSIWSDALRIVSHFKPSQYINKIAHVFRLDELDHSLEEDQALNEVVTIITEFLNWGDYDRASWWISRLHLQQFFIKQIPEIAIYVFSTNNRPILDRIISDCPELIQQLIQYLDSLIDLSEFSGRYKKKVYKTHEIKFLNESNTRSNNDKLVKLVIKYAKRFKLDHSLIRNTMLARAFKYLMHKHHDYLHENLSEKNYEETIVSMARDDREIRDFIIDYYCKNRYYKQGIFLAKMLEIHDDEWPHEMTSFAKSHPSDIAQLNLEIGEKKLLEQEMKKKRYEPCYLFDPNRYPIYMVDNKKLLEAVVEDILECEIIGIDLEWRPIADTVTEKAALVQIATSTNIYLIDVIELEKALTVEDWRWFFEAVFCAEDVKKIGFSLLNDLRVLVQTFPWLCSYMEKITNSSICLFKAFGYVVLREDAFKAVFTGHDKSPELNLASLSYHILKVPLDKTERLGNWAQRPLRIEQKRYAAMDAYCLIQLYCALEERLKTKLEDFSIIDEIFAQSRVVYTEKKSVPVLTIPKVKGEKRQKQKVSDEKLNRMLDCVHDKLIDEGNYRTVKKVRLIVDNMLNHVGKELRRCGISTTLVNNRREVIEFATSDPKCEILTMGKAYKELVPMFPGRVHEMPAGLTSGHTLTLQIEHVLKTLKILVGEEDRYTRCIKCNDSHFVTVPCSVVKYLYVAFFKDKNFDFIKYTAKDVCNARKALLTSPECEVKSYKSEEMTWATAKCEDGAIDLTHRLVMSNTNPIGPTKIKIEVSLGHVVDFPMKKFYVCSQCGHIFYDGSHVNRQLDPSPKMSASHQSAIDCEDPNMCEVGATRIDLNASIE